MPEGMVKSQMNPGLKAQSKVGRFRPLNSGGLVGLLKGVRGVRLVLAVGIVHEGMHKVGGVECKELNLARLPRGSQASQRSPPNESEALLLLWVFGGRGEQEGGKVDAVCRDRVDLPFGLQVCYWEMLYSFMVKQCTLGDIRGG